MTKTKKTPEEIELTKKRVAVRAMRAEGYDVHFKELVKVPSPYYTIYVAMYGTRIIVYCEQMGQWVHTVNIFSLFRI